MPPVKTRLTLMVDMDVAQYYEEQWNDEIVCCIKEGKAKPSFSEYMNKRLRKYIELEKAGKFEMHVSKEELERENDSVS